MNARTRSPASARPAAVTPCRPAEPRQVGRGTAAGQQLGDQQRAGQQPAVRAPRDRATVHPPSQTGRADPMAAVSCRHASASPTRLRLLDWARRHPCGTPGALDELSTIDPARVTLPGATGAGYWSDRRAGGRPRRGETVAAGVRTDGIPVLRRRARRRGWTRWRPACAAPGTAARTSRHLARRRRGFRLQPAVHHRHGALAPAAALGPTGESGTVRAGVQRRDLQLPGARDRADRASSGRQFRTEGDGEAIVAGLPPLGHRPRCPSCAACSRS